MRGVALWLFMNALMNPQNEPSPHFAAFALILPFPVSK